jgi:ATPase subunit of ABC transporter with duplicated ATPase domains
LLTEDRLNAFEIPKATELRFPGPLISLENVSYQYTKGRDTLQNINLSISIGDRIGILGLNGAGKTTLIKLLVGDIQSTSGSVTYHPRLKTGWYTQHAVDELRQKGVLDPDLTALRHLSRIAGDAMTEQDVRGLLGSFGLAGRIASDVPVTHLSGGQLESLISLKLHRVLLTFTRSVLHSRKLSGDTRIF